MLKEMIVATLLNVVAPVVFVIGVAPGPAAAQVRTASSVSAQASPSASRPGADRSTAVQDRSSGLLIPLRVQLVISRYDGDRKISSQPYTLSVNATPKTMPPQPARLRMGAEVPVSGFVPASPDGKPPVGGPVQYKAIGTNIDCFASPQDDGRYALDITVEDTSVYASDKAVPGTMANSGTPVFRSFKLTNTVVLRDGQSAQFTAATDKITGETVKLDVTVNALK